MYLGEALKKIRSTKENPVRGYKVFYIDSHGEYQCPYYPRPNHWKVRKGAVLTARLRDCHSPCGPGVNFWNEIESALSLCKILGKLFFSTSEDIASPDLRWVIWEVEVPPGHIVYSYSLDELSSESIVNKSRTSKVKLIRRVR